MFEYIGDVEVFELVAGGELLMPCLAVMVVEEHHVGQIVVMVDDPGQVDHRFVPFVGWDAQLPIVDLFPLLLARRRIGDVNIRLPVRNLQRWIKPREVGGGGRGDNETASDVWMWILGFCRAGAIPSEENHNEKGPQCFLPDSVVPRHYDEEGKKRCK